MAKTTLRQARDQYFAESGFDERTYVDPWVDLELGPIPFRFPNTASRKRIVPLHDLHHALTGYKANMIGEAEIGAWEIGSGIGPHAIGWALNLLALMWFTAAPRRVFRAFVRGRRSQNFYLSPFDPAVLDEDVDVVRRRMNIEGADLRATATDYAAFAGYLLVAAMVWALGLMLTPLMLAMGLWGVLRSRREAPAAG